MLPCASERGDKWMHKIVTERMWGKYKNKLELEI